MVRITTICPLCFDRDPTPSEGEGLCSDHIYPIQSNWTELNGSNPIRSLSTLTSSRASTVSFLRTAAFVDRLFQLHEWVPIKDDTRSSIPPHTNPLSPANSLQSPDSRGRDWILVSDSLNPLVGNLNNSVDLSDSSIILLFWFILFFFSSFFYRPCRSHLHLPSLPESIPVALPVQIETRAWTHRRCCGKGLSKKKKKNELALRNYRRAYLEGPLDGSCAPSPDPGRQLSQPPILVSYPLQTRFRKSIYPLIPRFAPFLASDKIFRFSSYLHPAAVRDSAQVAVCDYCVCCNYTHLCYRESPQKKKSRTGKEKQRDRKSVV